MKKEDCFHLGYISRAVGIKGEVEFFMDVDEPLKYKKLDKVFIEIENKLVEFFIETIRFKNKEAVSKLKSIETRNQAEELKSHQLYLPLNLLPKLKGKQFYFHEVTGFKVIDKDFGEVGIIETILDYPRQQIFSIRHKSNKEVLIPIQNDLIEEVDRENKTIRVSTPDGLIDVYLGSSQDKEDIAEEN